MIGYDRLGLSQGRYSPCYRKGAISRAIDGGRGATSSLSTPEKEKNIEAHGENRTLQMRLKTRLIRRV